MVNSGDRVLIHRAPSVREDPEEAWNPEFEEMIGEHGTVVEDAFPYAPDTQYVLVDVDGYDNFFLPMPILINLTEEN